MKGTRHNGRSGKDGVYNPLHNDRRFDPEHSEHVMIILGDAGINYWLDLSDKELKGQLSGMNITFFCVHGNHEARPCEATEYEEKIWNEGIVYVEEQYPNILFAKDGEIYNFHGKKVMPIGGAYSVDKYCRIRNRLPWFESEQPDEMIKEYVEQQLDKGILIS